MDIMDTWWSRAERIAWELEQLDAAGFRYDPPDGVHESGPLDLMVYVVWEGVEHPFKVRFPEFYPAFRFEVRAPTLELDHHQNPFAHNLCLNPRGTEAWRPTTSVAHQLQNQLPAVLTTGNAADPQEARELEEHQAEPFSEYYPYHPGAMLLIDGSWEIPSEATSGDLVIGLKKGARNVCRGAVLQVLDDSGTVVASMPSAVASQYPSTVKGRWVRLEQPIREERADAFFAAAQKADSHGRGDKWVSLPDGAQAVYAVLFPEEKEWRDGGLGTGWVFVAGVRRRPKQRGKKNPASQRFVFIRAGRAGERDLRLRVPELRALRRTTVAVLGLGCIGAPSALEFARSGVGRLRLLDGDFMDPGTAVRWPLGLAVAGMDKVGIVRGLVEAHYPHSTIDEAFVHRLGHVDNQESDMKVVRRMLEGASLVFDATAEPGVHYFLSEVARRAELPYVAAWGTHGGWGGTVLRLRPGRTTGCWWCYRKQVEDEVLPEPPGADDDRVQPQGCGDPTFVGGSFDLGTVALMGVRAAVELLAEGNYPVNDWDVLVVSLRKESGAPRIPVFDAFTLHQHPKCPLCQP